MATLFSRRAFAPGRLLAGALLLGLSGMFLFSAATKLVALQVFGWTIRDAGIQNEALAAFGAHALVGLEIFLGLALLFRVWLRRVTLPATIVLLLLFSAYLAYTVSQNGWDGDCGCYGAVYHMSPGWALLRNGGMVLAAGLVYALPALRRYRGEGLAAVLCLSISVALPVVFGLDKEKPVPVDLSAVYAYGTPAPKTDVRQGRHVVAFFSLGCQHCRTAAKILSQIYKQRPALPILTVLNGKAGKVDDFMRETGAFNLPYTLITESEPFIKMAGAYVPAIFFIENGKKVRRLSYGNLSGPAMERWTGR